MASDSYAEWAANSSEWAALRLKVLLRARSRCEACGEARAVHVHHLTYKYGRLPPIWCLKAVCSTCHARLHGVGDAWCGPGMER
jgi:5-methylcytosine-specific restriction endonuclease McrA